MKPKQKRHHKKINRPLSYKYYSKAVRVYWSNRSLKRQYNFPLMWANVRVGRTRGEKRPDAFRMTQVSGLLYINRANIINN